METEEVTGGVAPSFPPLLSAARVSETGELASIFYDCDWLPHSEHCIPVAAHLGPKLEKLPMWEAASFAVGL